LSSYIMKSHLLPNRIDHNYLIKTTNYFTPQKFYIFNISVTLKSMFRKVKKNVTLRLSSSFTFERKPPKILPNHPYSYFTSCTIESTIINFVSLQKSDEVYVHVCLSSCDC